MNRDSFYTPTILATKLISFIDMDRVSSIADFCIGNGELVRAAVTRWPFADCYGTDISLKVIRSLKAIEPRWNVERCDFLNRKTRSASSFFRKLQNGIDLVLMNPPFSCLGGTKHKILFNEKEFYVSTSMLFLVEALQFLSPHGELLAIVPNSVAYSEKDKNVWYELQNQYCITILEEHDQRQFDECSPHVLLLSIKKNNTSRLVNTPIPLKHTVANLTVFRGKISMHKLSTYKKGDSYLVHTTNLTAHSINSLKHKISNTTSRVCGPAILIPRVGTPNLQKVCLIGPDQCFVLSDCVLAILTTNVNDANILYRCLSEQWVELKKLYKGTGAKYITVSRLSQFLERD